MHARVLLLFWERVGGCHPRGKHRLEEALGALMVFWVPRPSVLSVKGFDMLCGDISPRGTVKCFCLQAGAWSSAVPKHKQPKVRGTDLRMGKCSQAPSRGYLHTGVGRGCSGRHLLTNPVPAGGGNSRNCPLTPAL